MTDSMTDSTAEATPSGATGGSASAGSAAGAPAPPPMPQATGLAVFTAGQHFPQFFVLLFMNIAFLMGAILPWNGGETLTTGLYTYPGAIIGFLAIGSVLASLSSIFSRRLVIWPTLLCWLVADGFVVARLLSLFREQGEVVKKVFSADFKEGVTELGLLIGPGFVFIALAAVAMLVFLVVSVFSGARSQAKKKEAQKQARTTTRKPKK